MSGSRAEQAGFRNGIALVAGGSGGLGRAICEKLAAQGVDVAFTYHRNAERATATAVAIESHGTRAMAIQTDLVDTQQVAQLIERVTSEWGSPSSVIYAAGPQLHFKYISQLDPALFKTTMEQDVFGFYNLVSASLPLLRQEKGALVALSTPAIVRFTKKDILSIAPKAAIHSVVRGIAVEEGRFGVRANSVGVGLVGDAGLFDSLTVNGSIDDKFMQPTYERVALQRLGKAHEIAEAVSFLASERASFITGQILMTDGGLST